jgi:hypothetical protein
MAVRQQAQSANIHPVIGNFGGASIWESNLFKNAASRRNSLLFSPRAGAHVGAIARIVAVHAALGGDDDHPAADLNGAGLAADGDGALGKDVSPTYSHIKTVSALAEPCAPTECSDYNFMFSPRLGGSARGFGFGGGRCIRA